MNIPSVFFFLFVLLTLTPSTVKAATGIGNATTIVRPGCSERCGNVTIPYPFGINGDESNNCFFPHLTFNITCNTSFNPPRPFVGGFEVVQITDNHIRVRNSFMVSRCFNSNGGLTLNDDMFNFTTGDMYLTVSDLNVLRVTGCDEIALIRATRGKRFGSGCVSVCWNDTDVQNEDSCSGIGCCQIKFPKGVKDFEVALGSISNHTQVWSFNPCGYAFVGEETKFKYGGASYLSDPTYINRTLENVPLVLDWVIGNKNCENISRNSNDYACLNNTHCVDSEDTESGGYRCSCNDGFEGNPYLDGGCTDINECTSDQGNLCEQNCYNTPGSYFCSCPDGFYGDGFKNGTRCIAKAKNNSRILQLSLGICAILLLLPSMWWMYKLLRKREKKKLRQKFFKRNGGLLLQQQLSTGEDGNIEKNRLFSSKELQKATDHYNKNRILGKGGQGTVYKGMLTDGRIVAVKRSTKVDESQLGQFINEVAVLSQINHRNIVKLHGCCLETEVPLLVYEFIPNGTLFQYIHDENEEFPLTWDVRLRIAAEVAAALSYLHSAASLPIYHRDIKSANILLDDKYRSKVADFGTSRSIAVDQTHLTTRVLGTFGYLDPEYFQSSQFTEKSDVYSFAIVLVELLTGQNPISSTRADEMRSLATYFMLAMEENRLFDIIDSRIQNESAKEEIMGVASLARRCLNLDGRRRPTMKEVAMKLEAIRMSEGVSVSTIQQHSEEYEYDASELASSWETNIDSTSTLNLDVHPLLISN